MYWLFKLVTGKEGMNTAISSYSAWVRMDPVSLLPMILLSSLIGALVGGS